MTNTVRGGLVGRIREADRIAQAKLGRLKTAIDRMSDTGGNPPFGGGALRHEDFRQLLLNDPATQARVAAGLPYATDKQREALERELVRTMELMPAQAPQEVTTPPPLPFPEAELRRP